MKITKDELNIIFKKIDNFTSIASSFLKQGDNIYTYKYYDFENGIYKPNKILNERYNNTRKDFEKFKMSHKVGYSGEKCLREVYGDGDKGDVIGYVLETRTYDKTNRELANKNYKNAVHFIMRKIGIKKKKEFKLFIDKYYNSRSFNDSYKLENINLLKDLLEDYIYDSNTRIVIDVFK